MYLFMQAKIGACWAARHGWWNLTYLRHYRPGSRRGPILGRVNQKYGLKPIQFLNIYLTSQYHLKFQIKRFFLQRSIRIDSKHAETRARYRGTLIRLRCITYSC